MDTRDDIATRQARVAAEVAAIGQMDLEALRRLWSMTIGTPPKLRSAPLLRLHLAWRIQAQAFGGLEADARRSLRKPGAIQPSPDGPPIGAILSREWQGVTHAVTVTEQGYLYDGKPYANLSQIARQIAGSRWNGPRFFGLRSAGAGNE